MTEVTLLPDLSQIEVALRQSHIGLNITYRPFQQLALRCDGRCQIDYWYRGSPDSRFNAFSDIEYDSYSFIIVAGGRTVY